MIEFRQVSKAFNGQDAVSDLNLHFKTGAFTVLIGTSGSGKSTTLKMINRLVEHDTGTILFAGEEIRSFPMLTLRRRMGYAIQSIGLFPHWTVAENIATVPQLQKWPRARIAARVDELMALLGLDPGLRSRYPHELSGGQQQRGAGAGGGSGSAADGRAVRRARSGDARGAATGDAPHSSAARAHHRAGNARHRRSLTACGSSGADG